MVASSSEEVRLVELFELQADEGPCTDCYRTGEPALSQDLAGDGGRWPRFGPVALKAGFRSAQALPMRLRGATIGALNLFRAEDGPLGERDVVAAQALAAVATIAILQHRAAVQAHVVTEQLQHALNSRVMIEQAKGMLAERVGLDMNEAFAWLRNYARTRNLLLGDVARAVSDGTVVPEPSGDAPRIAPESSAPGSRVRSTTGGWVTKTPSQRSLRRRVASGAGQRPRRRPRANRSGRRSGAAPL